MQNKTLIAAGRKILKDLLPKCTEAEQHMFKRFYSNDDLARSVEEAIDNMDPDRIDWAITQVENALSKSENHD
jgi:hypothetical protein